MIYRQWAFNKETKWNLAHVSIQVVIESAPGMLKGH